MLANRIASIEAQIRFSTPRNNRPQKIGNVETNNYYVSSDEEDEEVAVEWIWRHSELFPWAKTNSNDADKYDFDVTKADKIFDMLIEKGHIQLTANHKMPSAEELKKRRYCKYHDTNTHHTYDCRVFHECIQKAIEQGRIGPEKNKKTIDIEGHPFPQNMVAAALPIGKTKVLTLDKARKAWTIDLESQMRAEEYHEVKRRRDRQKSRLEQAESSKAGAMRR
jgi:hypothetical protein